MPLSIQDRCRLRLLRAQHVLINGQSPLEERLSLRVVPLRV